MAKASCGSYRFIQLLYQCKFGHFYFLLINLSNELQTISNNDRIAQLVVAKVEMAELTLVQQLDETVRAAGGFGHTGK